MVGIFCSRHIERRLAKMLDKCRLECVFTYMTVDSTVKPTLPLLGHVGHNRKRVKNRSHAAPYSDQLRAAHIVRGSRGDVLLAEPLFAGNIESSGILYMGKFNDEIRSDTLYFCASKTNISLETMTRAAFCNLRGCAIGQLHLAFAIEASSRGKRKAISTQVSKAVAKLAPCRFRKASGGE